MRKMKNITKLKNTTNEKYWKQCTEIHFRPFTTTISSELTRMIPFFYRQIVQANFV